MSNILMLDMWPMPLYFFIATEDSRKLRCACGVLPIKGAWYGGTTGLPFVASLLHLKRQKPPDIFRAAFVVLDVCPLSGDYLPRLRTAPQKISRGFHFWLERRINPHGSKPHFLCLHPLRHPR